MKVVLDTNILINATDDGHNYGSRIIDAVLDGTIKAYANPQTLRENALIVSRKISNAADLQKITDYFNQVNLVEGPRLYVVEDEEDNKILSSAVAAGADYLVTADWHLLKIGEYEGVKIVTAQGFWAEYESQTGEGWQNWVKNFMQ